MDCYDDKVNQIIRELCKKYRINRTRVINGIGTLKSYQEVSVLINIWLFYYMIYDCKLD